MKSITSIYKEGIGPSSSHSMGPRKAAELFRRTLTAAADKITVELYGSLAATGKGHLTDKAVSEALPGHAVTFVWKPLEYLPQHSNAMIFTAYEGGKPVQSWTVYSVGGGDITDGSPPANRGADSVYETDRIAPILSECSRRNQPLLAYILSGEGDGFLDRMQTIWTAMKSAVGRGLEPKAACLPGPLKLNRRANAMFHSAGRNIGTVRDMTLISAYALAVAEENADGGQIVTAPTCGSCGVLPGILYFLYDNCHRTDADICKALAVAGLFGVSIATCASISGAEVGCQGEIGTACAMASAAAAYLLGASNEQIEYAAEMGLEHFLGLTCDPVKGYVQIPCIERNAFAAMRALESASYAVSTDGRHVVSFDDVVRVMNETGRDLQRQYRETSLGGLAAIFADKLENA
ncbi:MAG: L-serine ammonia-lyase, iron-sulfur-dependent, subunit alpha [Planctomycetales bacterium]|nr:L-serine ammonia-lyase, iron-sulfur-dependent, subunit alpha [Planctomycetales bacterium]